MYLRWNDTDHESCNYKYNGEVSMKNRRPAYLWISIIIAVLLFLVLAVIIMRERRFLFTSINNAVISEETVLGIDSDRMDTTVFLSIAS